TGLTGPRLPPPGAAGHPAGRATTHKALKDTGIGTVGRAGHTPTGPTGAPSPPENLSPAVKTCHKGRTGLRPCRIAVEFQEPLRPGWQSDGCKFSDTRVNTIAGDHPMSLRSRPQAMER